MALEQEPKKEEGSSVLSKVLWGAAIAGAAVGAVYASPAILHGIGSVSDKVADTFFTTASTTYIPSGSVAAQVPTDFGATLHNFGNSVSGLGDSVSKTLTEVFTNPATATAASSTVGTVETVKAAAGNLGSDIKHAAGVLMDNPGATATIAGSAVIGTGVGLGVKSWAQKVGERQKYDTMAARIEAERGTGGQGQGIV